MTIINDVKLLHPKFAGAVKLLAESCRVGYQTGLTKTNFKIFETFRDPMRQNELLAKGASKAGQFASAHQFGLAVDMVPYLSAQEATALGKRINERVLPGWNWHSSHDYAFLKMTAKECGLAVPIAWDLVHVEHPQWPILSDWLRKQLTTR